jgi:hypothetical protein
LNDELPAGIAVILLSSSLDIRHADIEAVTHRALPVPALLPDVLPNLVTCYDRSILRKIYDITLRIRTEVKRLLRNWSPPGLPDLVQNGTSRDGVIRLAIHWTNHRSRSRNALTAFTITCHSSDLLTLFDQGLPL